ncbi:MAG: chromosome segregation protein SMC [Acidimicrobiia bacterium]
MFLRSLTLKGFKSFAEATTIELEPGVAVVVGPNGSGKSNVVDAIAWVLGAQAPSAVRSQKMYDVIFAGTAKRPALGRAEVSLTIDNSAGILPIDFTEVTVTRTLFRTGESEYAINGVSCRLLDVTELLSDSGVGRQQHVIVSQGQIDAVLNARPEDRRSIIEEAAGVLKFRKRRESAQRKLDRTQVDLDRLQDLLREVRRQLRPLERQAEAARRHGDLITELKALQVFLAGREIATLRHRLENVARDRVTLVESESALKTNLSQLDVGVMATEARLTAMGGSDISDALRRAESLRERARGLTAVLHERRRGIERDRGALMDAGVVATLEAEAARLAGELDDVALQSETLGPDAAEVAEAEEQLARDRADFEQTWSEGAPQTASGAAAEVRGELSALRASVDRGSAEVARTRTRLTALDDRIGRLTVSLAEQRDAYQAAEAGEEPLVNDIEEIAARRAERELALAEAEAALRAAESERNSWVARAEALSLALDQARARAGAQRLANLDGLIGTLLDLVDVDQGWEAAFEAAAGEALGAVVVADVDAGRRALAALESAGATGAVVALGLRPSSIDAPPVGQRVRDHVRPHRPEVAPLLDAIIGPAVAVDGGWAEAVDIALAHPDAIVVTRNGDRFGASGWRLGGGSAGATGAALEEATTKAEAAKAEVERAKEIAAAAKTAVNDVRQQENELARRLDANDAKLTAASDALTRTQGERRDATTEAEALRGQLEEATARVERERERVAELEAVLPSLEAEEAAGVEQAKAFQMARARLEERAASVRSMRADLDVRRVGLDERRTFLQKRLAETEHRLENDKIERARAEERRVRLDRALGAVDRLSAVVAAHASAVDEHLGELREQRRRQSEEARTVTEELDSLRRQRASAERQLEELRERARRAEIDEAEIKMRLEAAVESLRHDHDMEPETAMAAEMPALPEGISGAARVRDLERELRLLGPINPLALEEFNALTERHTFLEAQLEDVKNTRRELHRVIRAVDGEIQNVFAAAYADVASNFEKLFSMLFPGGQGKLTLTAPDDLLNTGIEVEAKPSGKNVKKLSLLSGGERSLTALAFLFAVFRSRPSPFYVMDEVEAALDDVNLHRFLGLIEEFRNEAQLLIVSHQKRTMEAADCLFGVTMQPGGSSRVVSEKVKSAS